MPKNYKHAFIAIFSILFIGAIYSFSVPYLSREVAYYATFLFIGVFMLGFGYFLRIWLIEYTTGMEKINKLEKTMKEASETPSSNDKFGYTMSVFKTMFFVRYRLILIVILLVGGIYQGYTAGIINLYINLFSSVLIIAYFMLWRFRFAIDSKNIYLSYATMMGGRDYSPISISEIKKHLIKAEYREDLTALLIRTRRPPLGERPFNPIVQFFFTPAIYKDPNIMILVRSKADADEILKRLELSK